MQKNDIINILRLINTAERKPGEYHVGAIYDSTSPCGNNPAALIVGINYGQIMTSKDDVGKSESEIDYAKYARTLHGMPCHTILWNFYPYLTSSGWTEEITTSKKEAELIFEKGYINPFDVFASIIHQLNPSIIIFHGVTSAVPLLARVALRLVNKTGILVPNLGRGLNIGKKTSIY